MIQYLKLEEDMIITVFDKTVEVDDYEIIVKNNQEGELVLSIKYDGVFSVECTEHDTKRVADALNAAVAVLSKMNCNTIEQEIGLTKEVFIDPAVAGCRH
jgi:hypothetical protein